MKQSKWIVLSAAFLSGAAGIGYADTISGRVKDIDIPNRSITVIAEPSEIASSANYKLVWDADLADSARLNRVSVGEFLSVEADQNAITRNWKVTTVRGPLATLEDAASSEKRVIEGKIQSIDTAARSLVLLSGERDASGNMIDYRVVWDDSNTKVDDRLVHAKVGDNLSLKADQNQITRNWKADAVVGPVKGLMTPDVKTITGEVRSVDPGKNSIVLRVTDASGKTTDKTLVWDKDFRDQAKLDSLRTGDRLTVRADQNALTRNWKVKSLNA